MYAGFYLAPRDIDETIALVGLQEKSDTLGAQLSGRQRRRLDVALAQIGDPDLIFLDEPTTGLDPRSRRSMWAIIRDLVAGGVTIFLTTQHLEEADQLADRIAVLDQGKLVAQGTTDQLKALIPGGHVRLQFADANGLESAARALGAASSHDDRLELQVPERWHGPVAEGPARSARRRIDRGREILGPHP